MYIAFPTKNWVAQQLSQWETVITLNSHFSPVDFPSKQLLPTSLVVQWLRLCASNAGGAGLILPGQGTGIRMLSGTAKKKKKKKLRPTSSFMSIKQHSSPFFVGLDYGFCYSLLVQSCNPLLFLHKLIFTGKITFIFKVKNRWCPLSSRS